MLKTHKIKQAGRGFASPQTKRAGRASSHNYTKTYYIINCGNITEDAIDFKYFRQSLEQQNIHEDQLIHNTTVLCDVKNMPNTDVIKKLRPLVLWFSPNYIKLNVKFYCVRTYLSNLLNNTKLNLLVDKFALYANFIKYNKQLAHKYLPLTFMINELDKYNFNTHASATNFYILKPIDSFGGTDIFYVSNLAEVDETIKYYNKTKNYKNRLYSANVIAQQYITNPLLYHKNGKGYKCHFRVMFMLSYINRIAHGYMFKDIIRILTAKEPYTLDLPFNKEVHDTHIKSSGDDYFLDEDYAKLHITKAQKNSIIDEFEYVLDCLIKICVRDTTTKWLYPEHKNAFNILGIDFMLTDTLDIKLIECNQSPSFVFHNAKNMHILSNAMFKWINTIVFEPLFHNT